MEDGFDFFFCFWEDLEWEVFLGVDGGIRLFVGVEFLVDYV